MDSVTLIGVIGATIILVAFILNQSKILSSESKTYDWANLIGSLVLIIYAAMIGSVPFMILNFVWFVVSLRDLIKPLFR